MLLHGVTCDKTSGTVFVLRGVCADPEDGRQDAWSKVGHRWVLNEKPAAVAAGILETVNLFLDGTLHIRFLYLNLGVYHVVQGDKPR